MHKTVQNIISIRNEIELNLSQSNNNKLPKIIAVSKTFNIEKILPLIEYGHIDFGENKVQEAVDKWSKIKLKNSKIKIHMLGKLQTNKVKFALQVFDFIHSLDSEKLAKKISDEQIKLEKNIKFFIQVNIGHENQKSGISEDKIVDFYNYCTKLNLDVIGLMCIPPINLDPAPYFQKMQFLNQKIKKNELSMGMSTDYLEAIKNNATYLRIGTNIFGKRG
jgi:pyridoxal phosphate enzyme (YggS family)